MVDWRRPCRAGRGRRRAQRCPGRRSGVAPMSEAGHRGLARPWRSRCTLRSVSLVVSAGLPLGHPSTLGRAVEDGRERLVSMSICSLAQHLLEVELQVLERAERLEALGARHARHERVHHVQLRPVAIDRVGANGRQFGALAQDEGERRRAERLRLRVHLLARAVVAALAERHLVVDRTQTRVGDANVAPLVVARREDGTGVDATNGGAHRVLADAMPPPTVGGGRLRCCAPPAKGVGPAR